MLGGKAKKANIELHDVRWVVGSNIEDTYDALRKDWFGSSKGLHIELKMITLLKKAIILIGMVFKKYRGNKNLRIFYS